MAEIWHFEVPAKVADWTQSPASPARPITAYWYVPWHNYSNIFHFSGFKMSYLPHFSTNSENSNCPVFYISMPTFYTSNFSGHFFHFSDFKTPYLRHFSTNFENLNCPRFYNLMPKINIKIVMSWLIPVIFPGIFLISDFKTPWYLSHLSTNLKC